ncbi:hypothetical protein KOR42_22920 [Thalassoglobus neptunius]|uniref:Uncharacterized protein n=1 Tax=Thalassoglobus neptunius TaxID=1938619 RepID=A0A5C5X9Q9_9PLAN|nr:hypothetical protein [Thalassoglobus neptunius]TWT58905.1 hypothetical protein KOR42_22920 [Thalassoglobus neptunius]
MAVDYKNDAEFALAWSSRINKRIDVAGMSEEREGKLLNVACAFITPMIPGKVREVVCDVSDGISDEDISKYKAELKESAKSLNLPFSDFVVPLAVDTLFDYAAKGLQLIFDEE